MWLVNVILLYLAVGLLPTYYTLGNNLFTPLQAAFFVALVWNIVLWKVGDIVKDLEIKFKAEMAMMFVYLAFNFSTLWLLARLAVITGFGVSSYIYVFLLAFVANFVQYKTWQWTDKKRK